MVPLVRTLIVFLHHLANWMSQGLTMVLCQPLHECSIRNTPNRLPCVWAGLLKEARSSDKTCISKLRSLMQKQDVGAFAVSLSTLTLAVLG